MSAPFLYPDIYLKLYLSIPISTKTYNFLKNSVRLFEDYSTGIAYYVIMEKESFHSISKCKCKGGIL